MSEDYKTFAMTNRDYNKSKTSELCQRIDAEFARFLRGDLTVEQTKHEILLYLDKRKQVNNVK